MSEVVKAPAGTIDLKGRVSIYQPERDGLTRYTGTFPGNLGSTLEDTA